MLQTRVHCSTTVLQKPINQFSPILPYEEFTAMTAAGYLVGVSPPVRADEIVVGNLLGPALLLVPRLHLPEHSEHISNNIFVWL